MDVASSSFSEASAVFGGEDNFSRALDNIRKTYSPQAVLVGTTCLAETIGEDLRMMIGRYQANRKVSLPIVFASTPSYKDGHLEGYHAMVLSLVLALAKNEASPNEASSQGRSSSAEPSGAVSINILPPIVSPADLRHLREVVSSFGASCTMLPDYSDPLDGPIHDSYHPMPDGGTSIADISQMGSAAATIDLTMPGTAARASEVLSERGVPAKVLGLPIGVEATDAWIGTLEAVTGRTAAGWLGAERGRLLDAYADGHKYVFGKRVALYGDPEFVVALAKFALEIGMRPVLCATGARNRALSQGLEALESKTVERVLEDTDFSTIERVAKELEVELMIGNSKGYRAARSVGVPLLRLGFPIHDRIGAGRILSLGYRGTLALFDALVNAFLERVQDQSTVGFSYL
jgi:nitrogenase molybdenum-iron protein NifN